MYFLQEAALSKVVTGETDIEEVVRVTSPSRATPPGGGSSGPTGQSDGIVPSPGPKTGPAAKQPTAAG